MNNETSILLKEEILEKCPIEQREEVTVDEIKKVSELLVSALKIPVLYAIALPQLGINKYGIAIKLQDTETKKYETFVLFNPKLLGFSEATIKLIEQNISVPDVTVEITRSAAINVAGLTAQGTESEFVFSGVPAAFIQHAIDISNRNVFIDDKVAESSKSREGE